jgi:hypothetical protein
MPRMVLLSGAPFEQPAYGHERILLIATPRSKQGAYRLERQVFAEKGGTHFYDETAKDWVSWRGEYVPIETLGRFDSRESARQFMVERSEAAACLDGSRA